MFTGIVREVGRVVSFDGRRLVVDAQTHAAEGDSVAVDGVCLTAVDGSQLAFDVVDETLARSTLASQRLPATSFQTSCPRARLNS